MTERRGSADDITEAYYRGLMHAVGYRRADLDKPQIAVVNSWTDVNPGHQPLKELGQRVKEGIWAAGARRQSSWCPLPATAWPRGRACTISCPSAT